jgi:hypothetical protein
MGGRHVTTSDSETFLLVDGPAPPWAAKAARRASGQMSSTTQSASPRTNGSRLRGQPDGSGPTDCQGRWPCLAHAAASHSQLPPRMCHASPEHPQSDMGGRVIAAVQLRHSGRKGARSEHPLGHESAVGNRYAVKPAVHTAAAGVAVERATVTSSCSRPEGPFVTPIRGRRKSRSRTLTAACSVPRGLGRDAREDSRCRGCPPSRRGATGWCGCCRWRCWSARGRRRWWRRCVACWCWCRSPARRRWC